MFSALKKAPAAIALLAFALAAPAAGAEVDYLIVSPKKFEPLAREWAGYREARGRRPRVLVSDEVMAGVGGLDARRAALQSAIRQAYREGGSAAGFAVLILGDTVSPEAPLASDRIPCGYTADRSEQTAEAGRREEDIATDNIYALADDGDEMPDFAVGRVPVRSLAAGRAALKKVKDYEAGRARGPWKRRLSFFASQGGFGAIDAVLEQVFTSMADEYIPYDFDLNMTYANPKSPYVTAPESFADTVIKRFNDGALVLTYVGHGHDRRLDDLRWEGRRYPIVRLEDLERVNAGARAPIFFVVACYTGRFDRADDRDCIAETMLARPGGPAAIIASSRVSHPYPNAILQKDFFDQVCKRRVSTLGEALKQAKRGLQSNFDKTRKRMDMLATFMVPKKEREELCRSHMSMYNLFGDPGLEIAYPGGEASLGLELSEPGLGRVSAGLKSGLEGRAILSLEVSRKTIIKELEAVPAGAGRSEALRRNYLKANDKVVRRWEVPVVDGRPRWAGALDLSVPEEGRYFLKLYAWGEGWDAAASRPLSAEELRVGPPRKRRAKVWY